ncbi:fumarylacetoacetate hydrolase family protein [Burkholderia dolosa]|uniref:Fumarylacetoacetate hydrolase family protein n=1 Tax=Burkholderia dolosa TaxID=152500 RepID=A0A892IED8_9BURK|nr:MULTISPECIES: fumarylacetoacetate hydrolase family protein [Burkholderia]AKE02067.1 2-keto-4-pentenoate hydratase [Burkholderia cepacia]AJY11396.1 fumarylacetoacetate (FAA) hydrolase family protein [Burkholderia dolosa AU0158]AYZ95508.1 2-keto-4-pentenoate hydratase [Burkholderia dolosa]MBR8418105.1 fumarylacetoacetate hydrolase family protein [Burkholderia dolosa]MBY4659423.1 fumarylacetoacetate hydrolase family protein [Burkholderia dolosa]
MTTTTERVDGAAQHLVAARHAGVPGPLLPDAFRPEDVDTALAIQHRVADLLGEAVGGWKCASPPPDRVIVAPIFASTIREAGDAYRVAGDTPIARIEPEIAFVLDRDLPARAQPYDENDVRDAIREVRLVLEVLGCRYAEPARASKFELLADGQFNQGLCVGPVVPDGVRAPLAGFALSFDGALNRTIDGLHPDGDPLKPLVWLVNFLASRGDAARAGQIVTTGSYAGVIDVPLGDVLTVRFGDLGSLSVTLTA